MLNVTPISKLMSFILVLVIICGNITPIRAQSIQNLTPEIIEQIVQENSNEPIQDNSLNYH